MILFFDTETTGLPKNWKPWDDKEQPHIVQLAAILCDENAKVFSSMNFIVNPGVPIPKQASDIHGITDEIAAKYGVQKHFALSVFTHFMNRADVLCAHNVSFDIQMLKLEYSRRSGEEKTIDNKTFCTMNSSKKIVNLPPTERMMMAGNHSPKPPKLEECIRHFFGETLDGAHDAMVDVEACKRVYFHLKSLAA